jgi:hypothetical protein
MSWWMRVALAVAAAACGGDAAGPKTPGSLEAVPSAALAGRVGDTLAVAVRVAAAGGQPLAGQRVEFTAGLAGSTVTPAVATTDGTGTARTRWVLAPAAGSQLLTARVGTLAPLNLVATVGVGRPARISVRAGDEQRAAAGSPVATRPAVALSDAAGNPVPGVRVVFTPEAGAGRVTGDTVLTDDAGVATVGGWQLGPALGRQTLRARVAASDAPALSAEFTATAVAGAPARLQVVVAPRDTTTVATTMAPNALAVVAVTDSLGNPCAGALVTFAVRGGAQTLTVGTVQADTMGRATMPAFLVDTVAGRQTVVAVAGAARVEIPIEVRAGAPDRLVYVSGHGQEVSRTERVAQPLVVRVVDRYGNGVSDVEVRFAPLDVDGSTIAGAVTRSDAQGLAASGLITLALPNSSRGFEARVAGLKPMAFYVGFAPGPPSRLEWGYFAQHVFNQVARGGRTAQLDVRVSDDVGHAMPGVTVTLVVVPSTGGLVSNVAQTPTSATATDVSDHLGVASFYFLAGSAPGVVTLEARMPGAEPARLSVVIY